MKLCGPILCAGLLAALSVPGLFGQRSASRPTLYHLSEVGTFGGPNSRYNVFSAMARNDGTIVGAANTDQVDPNAPNCFDPSCFVMHAYEWHEGHLTDLGALPTGSSSWTNAINHRGLVVGHSEDGEQVPTTGFIAFKPTVWYRGQIFDIGTLGGYSGTAVAATDDNFVMGFSENNVVDNSGFASFFGFGGGTEIRAFGWSGGDVFDLGDLGGPGAIVSTMNKHGQVVGFAATSFTPGPFGFPPAAPYRWTDGVMRNLGTLGGKFGSANAINDHGHVVGSSSTADAPYGCFAGPSGCHPFLWKNGNMYDLGAPGGKYSSPNLINNSDQVAGYWSEDGPFVGPFHAVMWDHGQIIGLGTIKGDDNSNAFGMNSQGRVVGQTWHFNGVTVDSSHAFVWQKGQGIVDLNTVLTNETDLFLFEADAITDTGIIVAYGVKPNGDVRATVLTPETDPNASAAQRNLTLSPQARLCIANRGRFQPSPGLADRVRRSTQH